MYTTQNEDTTHIYNEQEHYLFQHGSGEACVFHMSDFLPSIPTSSYTFPFSYPALIYIFEQTLTSMS